MGKSKAHQDAFTIPGKDSDRLCQRPEKIIYFCVSDWPKAGDELAEVVIDAAWVMGGPVIGTNLVGMISNESWTGYIYGGPSIAGDQHGNILAR